VLAAASALAVAAAPAQATNGDFAHGQGTHYKAMAGAGVALHLDSLAPATNPAAKIRK
jgi:long-chain fatty acid transport protein